MRRLTCSRFVILCWLLSDLLSGGFAPTQARAQQDQNAEAGAAAAQDPPVELTAQEDHQRMLKLLGIEALRRGANGSNPQADNAANYDESKATVFPELPDPLTLNDGTPVTDAETWWTKRRPEIVEDFDREIHGRLPENMPSVDWQVREVSETTRDDIPVIVKTLIGKVDNSEYPLVDVEIELTLTLPAEATEPVPVIMQFSWGGFRNFGRRGREGGSRRGPDQGDRVQGNRERQRAGSDQGRTSRNRARFDSRDTIDNAPGDDPSARGRINVRSNTGHMQDRGLRSGERRDTRQRQDSWQTQVLKRGWGFASLNTGTIQRDNGAGLTRGIIGLVNKGQPRGLEDWGVLRAWGWGASKAMDYFEADEQVDAARIGVEGHSRWGKAALVAMAYDPRIAIGYISSSGAGGASLHRRNYGELVENVAASGEYHWMAGNFLKYAGPLQWDDLPIDAHQLVALCAPRPVFISSGNEGDQWVDPKGMFLAGVGAGPVYELLGQQGLGTAEFPPIETGLMDGDVAFRQHNGGHTDGPNWPTFLDFAARYFDPQ